MSEQSAQGDSMVIFGGCTHDEAYGDVWQLKIMDSHAHWVQMQTTGVKWALHINKLSVPQKLAGCGAMMWCMYRARSP